LKNRKVSSPELGGFSTPDGLFHTNACLIAWISVRPHCPNCNPSCFMFAPPQDSSLVYPGLRSFGKAPCVVPRSIGTNFLSIFLNLPPLEDLPFFTPRVGLNLPHTGFKSFLKGLPCAPLFTLPRLTTWSTSSFTRRMGLLLWTSPLYPLINLPAFLPVQYPAVALSFWVN